MVWHRACQIHSVQYSVKWKNSGFRAPTDTEKNKLLPPPWTTLYHPTCTTRHSKMNSTLYTTVGMPQTGVAYIGAGVSQIEAISYADHKLKMPDWTTLNTRERGNRNSRHYY